MGGSLRVPEERAENGLVANARSLFAESPRGAAQWCARIAAMHLRIVFNQITTKIALGAKCMAVAAWQK